ncbi:MAG: phosphodiester glycosidase family protein [Oscillospiraceae bacterium]|nr:phosphodiester glycosidase family protein [Oscillospiraceae bacterium]
MKHRKRFPLWAAIVLDIVAAAALVGGWFLARIVSDSMHQEEPIIVAEHRTAPVPTPAAVVQPAEEEAPPDEPEATPDLRSEWQIRFAEHFTPEVIRTEDSYSSPNLSVTVTHHTYESEKGPVAYHLADIYIGNIDCFRSGLAATPPRFRMSASLQKMAEDQNAVVAVNGDFCSYSYGGVAVRNGVVWSKVRGSVDLCVLYRDGTMETMLPREFDVTTAVERDVWQVWSFGPALLNADGTPREIPYSSVPEIHITGRNPRTAIGYYEPGHYCFLVADGRQMGYSVGMTLQEMSGIFSDLGCMAAFNLDGGGSSMMVFQGELISQIYSKVPRNLSDCVLVTDFDPTPVIEEELPAEEGALPAQEQTGALEAEEEETP